MHQECCLTDQKTSPSPNKSSFIHQFLAEKKCGALSHLLFFESKKGLCRYAALARPSSPPPFFTRNQQPLCEIGDHDAGPTTKLRHFCWCLSRCLVPLAGWSWSKNSQHHKKYRNKKNWKYHDVLFVIQVSSKFRFPAAPPFVGALQLRSGDTQVLTAFPHKATRTNRLPGGKGTINEAIHHPVP